MTKELALVAAKRAGTPGRVWQCERCREWLLGDGDDPLCDLCAQAEDREDEWNSINGSRPGGEWD